MAISAISRDWGPNNSIVRITTNDSFEVITAPGYLTAQAFYIAEINNGAFEWSSDDCCLILYGNGYGFFIPDYTVNFTFIPMAGNPLVSNYARVPISLTAFLANYATPVPILAAVPAQTLQVQNWAFEWIYGSAALAGGGAISLQYGTTIHGGGHQASNSIAAADLTGLSASGYEYSAGGLCAITGIPAITDVGIYLSNPSALFTGGTGGSGVVHVWYSTIVLP